jgi:L-asparaginase
LKDSINVSVLYQSFCRHFTINNTAVKGIIHAGTGNGIIHKETLETLNNAVKSGVIIVRVTRLPGGIVSKDENYEGRYKFIASDSLNPKNAKILLQLALTKYSTKDTKSIQELFYRY